MCLLHIFVQDHTLWPLEAWWEWGWGVRGEPWTLSDLMSLKKSLGDFCGYYQDVQRFVKLAKYPRNAFWSFLLIYLFWAGLGLCCCARTFSSCSEWGYRSMLFPGSRAQVQSLWCVVWVVPCHVGSSQTRDWTCVLCIGRWILIHCAIREVQEMTWTGKSKKWLFNLSIQSTFKW